MIKIVVDENIPAADECFGSLGEVIKKPGRQLSAQDVKDADALIVRSITQVNAALLAGSKVRFVGTATIGVDHVDQKFLQQNGIAFASAPGCNAQSVVEYVLTALLELERIREFSLFGKTVGIIGLGNVGSRLQHACKKLGLNVLACDLPLQQLGQCGLVSADEVWQADIVSLHVPLIKGGAFPTEYHASYERLKNMIPNAVLINTARGSVLDNRALSDVLKRRFDLAAVLDVWEGEPLVNRELVSQVDIATPHIAGYSHDGKIRGTVMIYQKLCAFLRQPAVISESELIPAALDLVLDFSQAQSTNPVHVIDVVRRVYNIRDDDRGLHTSLQLERRAEGFDALRKHYRVRREFGSVKLRGEQHMKTCLCGSEIERLHALGFNFN